MGATAPKKKYARRGGTWTSGVILHPFLTLELDGELLG